MSAKKSRHDANFTGEVEKKDGSKVKVNFKVTATEEISGFNMKLELDCDVDNTVQTEVRVSPTTSAQPSVSNPAELQNEEESLKIFVKTPVGKRVAFDLKPSATIEELKKLLSQKLKIPECDQRLIFMQHALDDSRTLSSFRLIQNESALTLENKKSRSMQIFVKNLREKTIVVNVQPKESVRSVKIKIQEIEGIPPCQQRLIFGGRQLDDTQTLDQCGVKKESTLHLIFRMGLQARCAFCDAAA